MNFINFKSDILYAIDLDGVIIDSINECFKVSLISYNSSFLRENSKVKKYFFKYRGLVNPAYEYYYLMCSIEQYLMGDLKKIPTIFNMLKAQDENRKALQFERIFFKNRKELSDTNFHDWINLNPLTSFGVHLKNHQLINFIIITTKNSESAKKILDYYKIIPKRIYGSNDVKNYGSKGKLLNAILNESTDSNMIFIDDSLDHLDSVNNKKIQCFFADWGYGKQLNDKFKTFSI